MMILPVLGHLFWDELLMFVVPVLLVLVAVRWAERRRPPIDSAPDPFEETGNVTGESTNSKGEQ